MGKEYIKRVLIMPIGLMGNMRTFILCKISVVFIPVLLHTQLFGVDIGSDTIVTRFNTRQVINNTDRVAGFASLAAGFRLSNALAAGTWDCFFPVSGDIGFSHGTLSLNQDLILNNVSTIRELGNIVGNSHNLDLSSSVTCIPTVATDGSGFSLIYRTGQAQADTVASTDWSFDGKFVAVGLNAIAAAHDLIQIYEFDGTTLTLDYTLPRDVYIGITSVRFHPSLYLLAVSRLSATGSDLLIYTVNPTTGVLTLASGLDFGGSVFAIDWNPAGTLLAVGKAPGTSGNEIQVHAVSSGGIITVAPAAVYNINPNRTVQNEALRWDPSGAYLAAGTSTNAANPTLLVLAYPAMTINASLALGIVVRSLEWNKIYPTYLAIGLQGTTGNLLQLYQHNAGGGTLTNVDNIVGLAQTVRSLSWRSQGDVLSLGRFATAGDELQLFGFIPSGSYLTTEVVGFDYTSNLNVVRWSPDGRYLAVGGDNSRIDIYEYQTVDQGCVVLSNLDIFLDQDLYLLQQCTHVSGDVMIDGGGHSLTLAPTCSLIVDAGSSLMLKDIIIENVSGDKIQMLDSLATISLQNVQYILDGNYSFTQGKLVVLQDFTISGDGYTFGYFTDQMSTISTYGRLILDTNLTFSYVPRVGSRALLNLLASTSELVLHGATLYTTDTGLRLTTGKLIVDRSSALYNGGLVEAEAISFANSLAVQVVAAATLDYLNGLIVYE